MPNYDLMWEHPPTGPDHRTRPLPYLIDCPSEFAPDSALIRFRDKTLLPLIATDPGDPDLPNFLKCIEDALAWRATIAPPDRFWRRDKDEVR